jgi:hypothetical protein
MYVCNFTFYLSTKMYTQHPLPPVSFTQVYNNRPIPSFVCLDKKATDNAQFIW